MLDKEKLIEHFKNKDARNVAIKIRGGDIDIVDGILGGDLWLSHGASMDMDNCFERLTTKEECLRLFLENNKM